MAYHTCELRNSMKPNAISLQRLVESLGGLHDARVIAIEWSAEDRRLRIVVDDIYANNRGLPEYLGPMQATVMFSDASRLSVEAELTLDGLSIYDWTISRKAPDNFSSVIAFSPGGKVALECRAIDIVRIEPPAE
jgi:hypothetical protein